MQLPAERKVPADPALWKCDDTGVTENLWLNLSTGHIGSGRQVWAMSKPLAQHVPFLTALRGMCAA